MSSRPSSSAWVISILATAILIPPVGAQPAEEPAYHLQLGSVARSRIVAMGRDLVIDGEALSHAVVIGRTMSVQLWSGKKAAPTLKHSFPQAGPPRSYSKELVLTTKSTKSILTSENQACSFNRACGPVHPHHYSLSAALASYDNALTLLG